jgi:asparagine synthase (glutamine-hydrolysing)
MADRLVHRGPDEEGLYLNERAPTRASIALAHRRLSIIDLSSGQQPLSNEDGTVWIVFNGEIYNFQELKPELLARGHTFRTNSDTEVIVHAYEEWGVDCLPRLNGMFAFAIWDERRQRLFMARDRLGKKPLYYRATADRLVFGSELKAVLAYPGVEPRPDPTAVADYFKYLYVPDPKTIFVGINKLPPASYCMVTASGTQVREYWDVNFEPTAAGGSGRSQLTDELFDLLDRAVRDRLMSEVPLGAFLSGGVDSSGVVALMARHSHRPVITCSVGFDDPRHDESRFAAHVASLLHTDHSEYFVNNDFTDVVPRLSSMFDEPFADPSAIPTYFVCKMARQRVTVALSGDGGDESFAGYDKYSKDMIERQVGSLVPRFLLRAINFSSRGDAQLLRKARTVTAQALRAPARAFYESNTFMRDEDLQHLLEPSVSRDLAGYDPAGYLTGFFARPQTDDHLTRMLYTDIKTYLSGDILVKVDRTSMANSLEVRAPLLDYRIVEFAARLPNALKLERGKGKVLLKEAFGRVLPREIFDRPKHGFTVPLDVWFRRDLVPLAEELFFRTPETAQFLNVSHIRKVWDRHRSGQVNLGTQLWSTLIFSLWYRDLLRSAVDPVREAVAS